MGFIKTPKQQVKENNLDLKKNKTNMSEKETIQIGILRALTQGATFGQASHLAGVLNETINFPQKVYNANSMNDIKSLYKDIGKDYIATRNNYKKAYEEFIKQHPNLSTGGEVIGGLVSEELLLGYAINLLKSGIDYTRLLREQKLLKEAYDEVKNNPLLGTKSGKDDVMVEIKPIRDKNVYVINRGAAIKDNNGNIIYQDKPPRTDLFDATGTGRNFGMIKPIFHGVSKNEVAQIPKIVRKYKSFIKKDNGNINYKVPNDSKYDLIIGFAKTDKNKNKLVTNFKSPLKNRTKIPLSKKK